MAELHKNREQTKVYDFINPNHYKKLNKEVWQMMVDIWGVEAFKLHCQMCAFKYRMRLGDKPNQPIDQDLQKAQWYEKKIKELTYDHQDIRDAFNPS